MPAPEPLAASTEVASAYAEDVGAALVVVESTDPIFGAASVPDAKRFTLRMSAPVKKLTGIADEGGFTVLIPGSLSLDRAGPISASHRRVRRSMILNKGDHSELTIRFAKGDPPPYQVKAKGAKLIISIGG